jgi:hypothetical protein
MNPVLSFTQMMEILRWDRIVLGVSRKFWKIVICWGAPLEISMANIVYEETSNAAPSDSI